MRGRPGNEAKIGAEMSESYTFLILSGNWPCDSDQFFLFPCSLPASESQCLSSGRGCGHSWGSVHTTV